MQNIKTSCFGALFILASGVLSPVAQAVEAPKNLMEFWENSAQQAKMPLEHYLKASQEFERLLSGSNPAKLTPLTETPEYKDAIVYVSNGIAMPKELEHKLISRLNQQEQEFATALGIPSGELNGFLSVYGELSLLARGEITTLDDKKLRRVVVNCAEDNCNSGSFGSGGWAGYSIYISSQASNMGIPYYSDFSVQFINRNSGNVIRHDVWQYSPFNAWRDRDYCDGCKDDDR
ncbi:hypothetical protein [Pseudoalteromonas piscicida]|uniref:Uncharacterized protein n=1 Tax=Pseudoalteromonas piscicida TaxID=43662 RepID=A0A2A5JPT5_PSEO7|nr:hypothetical protein [Pseudoalteromonas piscicida]PCK31446.1 hypothetical protein CEX98_12435 [Pseudoalteromonas piscicida]